MTTKIAPVYLVKGDDPALVAAALSDLRKQALDGADPGMALEDLSAEEITAPAIASACATPPFLSERKVVVVRDAGRFSADEAASLVDYLATPLETTVLILAAGGGTMAPKLVAAVKKAGQVVDAGAPRTAKARTSWVVERLHASTLTFDAAAGRLLESHLGEDLGRLDGIVATLVSTFGPGARVGADDVRPYLGDSGGVAPWDLTDALDKGDTVGALDALHRMINAGERHPLVVLSGLHRHYSAMLRLDGSGVRNRDEAAAILKTAPFPAEKAMRQGRTLGFAGIARALDLIAGADLDLKGERDLSVEGTGDGALVMEMLVARLSRLVRRG